MTRMTITLDDKTLLDGDLGGYQHRMPQALERYIKPTTKREPWVPALMAAILEAQLTHTATTVTIRTHTTGWSVAADWA